MAHVRLPGRSAGPHRGTTPPSEAAPGRGSAGNPLFGGWSATRWQYRSVADAGRAVDVVTDLDGSIALSLTANAFILVSDVAGRGKQGVSGVFEVRGDELVFAPDGAGPPERVSFSQVGDTLSLRSEASAWDFDGSGREEAAEFVAVLVRL
jgi:hypothetical protein